MKSGHLQMLWFSLIPHIISMGFMSGERLAIRCSWRRFETSWKTNHPWKKHRLASGVMITAFKGDEATPLLIVSSKVM
jgi:hypothetical protein